MLKSRIGDKKVKPGDFDYWICKPFPTDFSNLPNGPESPKNSSPFNKNPFKNEKNKKNIFFKPDKID